ncbi:MAG: fumarylacetoacetate hydrolase, partial [Pontimonas sp.]
MVSGETFNILPADAENAQLVARVWDPESGGPRVCRVVGDELVDITAQVPTVSELAEQPHRVEELGRGSGPKWSIEEVMKGSGSGDPGVPHFLAPIDLQVTKACGVTFVGSLIERVIEEKGGGDIAKADA